MTGRLEVVIQWILSKLGLKLQRISNSPLYRLSEALQYFEVDTLLDVGANKGQFAIELRQAGFKGRIISFEPLSKEHAQLEDMSKKDANWIVHPKGALGNKSGVATINIAGNSVSSSILDMSEAHSDADQGSKYIGTEPVITQTLDSIAFQYLSSRNKTFLKVDTQGFESQVLDGAVNTLPAITGVLFESSLLELYKGQLLWKDLIERLEKEGFTIWSIDRVFSDPRTGRTLQCDIAFFRA